MRVAGLCPNSGRSRRQDDQQREAHQMELLTGIARNPIPGGAKAGMFKGYDGTPLRYSIWNETDNQLLCARMFF